MAGDRLAAMRAEKQGNQSLSLRQEDTSYEMSDVKDSTNNLNDMSAFYTEISSIQDSIRTFNDNVTRISDLHSRSLDNTDEAISYRNASQLEEMVEETSALSTTLKRRIKALQRQGAQGRDAQIRKQQTELVKSKFIEAIQAYQGIEQQYRTKYKQRMERQYKIVKPDATPEEVRAVVNDEQGGQIFSQALLSNRYTESQAAYKEVQARHEDIKRIERTLVELTQLFNEMSTFVEQQDDTVNAIQDQASEIEKDVEHGVEDTAVAVKHARSARKKRIIIFIIVLVILAIVGIVVGVVVSNQVKN